MGLADRIDEVRAEIATLGRDPDSVTIVAVTKGLGTETVEQARALGLPVGESYAQELLTKAETLGGSWHFLGAIQRNKVKALAPLIEMWHGLSRVIEAEAIAHHRAGAPALVQVNLTGSAGRGGCSLDEVDSVVDGSRRAGVDVQGLMTVAPRDGQPAPAFAAVAAAARRLGLLELSMGMSGDYREAVVAGATLIRLGTTLFGPRPPAPQVRR